MSRVKGSELTCPEKAKDVLSDACSELHAELAFIWIAFVVTTLLFGYLIVQALRMRSRGVPRVSKHVHEDGSQLIRL